MKGNTDQLFPPQKVEIQEESKPSSWLFQAFSNGKQWHRTSEMECQTSIAPSSDCAATYFSRPVDGSISNTLFLRFQKFALKFVLHLMET